MNKIDQKEIAYRDLFTKIQTGELQPGEWLVEREMCQKYNISRTPMREIYWRLENDGLLVQTPGKGFQVKQLNLQEIIEIFQAREAVEGISALIVSNLQDENFFVEIKDLKEQLLNIKPEDLQVKGPQLGAKMHELIINRANNSLLIDFNKKLHNLYSLTVNITKKYSEIESESRDSHISIMEAIESRDGKLAEILIREHLRKTCLEVTKRFYPNIQL